MKSILSILFLFLYQFGMGQVPGTPFFFKGDPTVYTYAVNSPTPVSAVVTGEIITRGQSIAQSGIIWGTSSTLTIESATGSTTVTTSSGAKSATINGLVGGTIYYIAYYTRRPGTGTLIGNTISYEHGTVTTNTGRKWMQWNLGSTELPTSITGPDNSLGSLYQWGRGTDGHQTRVSANRVDFSSLKTFVSEIVNGKEYIFKSSSGNTRTMFLWNATATNWLDPNVKPLWQGVNGINNPCPSGYRLPSKEEFENEINLGPLYIRNDGYTSPLKLQNGGTRSGANGNFINGTNEGKYWTSTVQPSNNGDLAWCFPLKAEIFMETASKITGMSVRCIKDDGSFSSSGGIAKVQSYDCPNSGANGQMFALQTMDRTISQTITANVIEPGAYDLNAAYNNTRFTASGTFAGTGSQTITLNSNDETPLEAMLGTGNKYYLLNIDPYCEFERTVFSLTSYGTAKITGLTRPVYITGAKNMQIGVPVSGITHNVTATVEKAGTYSLTTNTVRGVTFIGNGSVTTGSNIITLTASGTPTEYIDSVNNDYTLTSSIAYSFKRGIYQPSSNGSAVLSSMTAGAFSVFSGARMKANTPITGDLRQYMNIAITGIGFVNIIATNNGVTFRRSNTYNTLDPNKEIWLIASGTPIAAGTFTFTTNTTPSVSFTITVDP